MPTHARPEFVPRAIANFLAQDIEDIELVILDDGPRPVRGCVPDHPRIRYLHSEQRQSVGVKRNLLCEQARADIIVHWDDDDWYPPGRVRRQVAALSDGAADASGSSTIYFYEPGACRAFQYRYPGRGAFVTGTTLAYRKSLWARGPFADLQVGEDTRFVSAIPRGRLVDFADPSLCVATIHPGNVSPKHPRGEPWTQVDVGRVHALLGETESRLRPTVSCIMPTADRRAVIPLTLELFAAQDYPDRELIVVDAGADAIGDLCEGVPGVRYFQVSRRLSIGARRNLACQQASGGIIVHWDDDDWYAPDRLTRQVEPILAGRADVTGLEHRHTLRVEDGSFWTVTAALHQRMFVGDVHGGTLAYRRMDRGPVGRYPDANLGEDAALLKWLLRRGARLERIPNEDTFVYVRHGRNAWRFEPGHFLDPDGWQRSERPARMPPSMVDRYREALSSKVPAPARAPAIQVEDCLRSTALPATSAPIRMERCVALVASEAHAELLDGALRSLALNGGIAEAVRVVFVVGPAPRCEQIARSHGALVLGCRALRPVGPAVKAALYSMATTVEARQYLCLDTDVLVLESLAELFEQHAALGEGRVLVARESMNANVRTLGQALASVYLASPNEVSRLTGGDPALLEAPHVINDGLFVADRPALLAIDRTLREAPQVGAWVHARQHVWWRQKAALNLALARLACGVELDPVFNVQLHHEQVERRVVDGRCSAVWQGRNAKVLHFNGSGRRAWDAWKHALLGSGG
ncbi:glycosyltransferase family 2 protein [Pyxidicoccus sp. 3LG]